MDSKNICKLDVDHFRRTVVEKLTVMVGGKVEDTGHHLRIAGGQDDSIEVELTFRKSGNGYATLVDGKHIRIVYAENDANAWTVAGETMAKVAAQKEQMERHRKERADTEKCLLLLKDFPLPNDGKCRCNVFGGKAHLEICASFGPDRIEAFVDMVEMARLTLEDGDVTLPAGNGDGIFPAGNGEEMLRDGVVEA
jgi:hypothetical protein